MLDIEPKNTALYFHPDNFVILKIINGSGNFNVTLDKDSKNIATISYNSRTREIKVSPLMKGRVHILVKDRNLDV